LFHDLADHHQLVALVPGLHREAQALARVGF